MEKTIYNTFVHMESQEQCDRMKQICIDNGLKIWEDAIAFLYDYKIGYSKKTISIFSYSDIEFAVWEELEKSRDFNFKVTEQEFIELLKTTK